MLAFVFATSLTFATNNSDLLLNDANHNFLIEQPQDATSTKTNDVDVSIVIDKSTKEMVGECKIKGSLTITTESGDSVTVEFSVTADTCKEAIAVQNQILEAFE